LAWGHTRTRIHPSIPICPGCQGTARETPIAECGEELRARHIHRKEDESFYILEGEVTAWIGDQTIRGTPGTLIFGPRGVPHSFEIHSDQVHMLILLTPAGWKDTSSSSARPRPR